MLLFAVLIVVGALTDGSPATAKDTRLKVAPVQRQAVNTKRVQKAQKKVVRMSKDIEAIKRMLWHRRLLMLRSFSTKKGWDKVPPSKAKEPKQRRIYSKWVALEAKFAPPKRKKSLNVKKSLKSRRSLKVKK